MLLNDDCLNVLKTLDNESIDMIYLDPPFYTQTMQKLSNADGKEYAFSDVWKSRREYIDYMRVRLREMKRVLKSTGDIFYHCDTSCAHYIRVLLDEVFGEENFRSEIIWTYKRWSNTQKGLLPSHQTIFFYSKTAQHTFHVLYGSYSPTTNIDQIMQKRVRNEKGKVVYKRDCSGNIIAAKEKKGVPLSDVWEIPFLNPKAKERTGYPTQKPIELLDRIIKISTNEGDYILDPFCGSGTTLVSALMLKRKYIGIDINPDAIELCKTRLKNPFKTSSSLLKNGANAYKTKNDLEMSILRQFDCDIVQRNKGIDALLRQHYCGKPVAIKIQKETETFAEAVTLLKKAASVKGCGFSILITSEKDWENNGISIPSTMTILNTYASSFERALITDISVAL